MNSNRIVIIGAGPTGLGCAYRLNKLGYKNWAIYEKEDRLGGLARSFKDKNGFTWDIGGHVMFSQCRHYNALADNLLGNDFISHQRESWIRMLFRWIPYPFQNNIRYLPKDLMLECLLGLIQAKSNDRKADNFAQWLFNTFGKGIAKAFLVPYNTKVWAVPLDTMDYGWVKQRISVLNTEKMLWNIIMRLDEKGWGPNNRFKFPLYGGTGGFFDKFKPFVNKRIGYKKNVARVDLASKIIEFDRGGYDKYDILVNTVPLDMFVRMIKPVKTDRAYLFKEADKLKHNGIFVVGIGLKKKIKSTRCWVYFPQKTSPFYRMTYFSRYSPHNVPEGDTDNYSSLLCEVSFSEYRPVDESQVIDAVMKGLVREGIISKADTQEIISKWLKKIDYAYPIPTLGRDIVLSGIQAFLAENNIYSRGRFGAWKYEAGNMDHCVMMGIELIDRILLGKKENIWKP